VISFTDLTCGVASDRVYSEPVLPQVRVSSYLAFPPLHVIGVYTPINKKFIFAVRDSNFAYAKPINFAGHSVTDRLVHADHMRFISVALSRRSPSADVIRYPAL